MEIFGININWDWSWIYVLGQQPLHVIAWHFFINGGWILFAAAFVYGGWRNYIYYQQVKFSNKQNYVFLAIDIPKNNLQTPKAVENIFAALAGADMPLGWWEKNMRGNYQLGFSFEIVSIDGFIQFLVRTPVQFRDLVEASIYSQYPEAEITEVEDYLKDLNVKFPSDEYNLWGADLVLVGPDYLPIKTYPEFIEESDKEFKDPMAAILEIMSKIGQGEQIWLQLLVSPADIGWQKKGLKVVNKTLDLPEDVKRGTLDKIADAPLKLITTVSDEILRGLGEAPATAKDDSKEFNMMRLDPMKKREVDAILRKVDKICFDCKFKFAYFGKREVFRKGLGVSGTMGAIKQFSSTGLNSFKPGPNKTMALFDYKSIRLARRQNKFFDNFKGRNAWACKGPYLLNTEELATIFHFPYIEVKTPLIKKVEARKGRAPIGLPVEEEGMPSEMESLDIESEDQEKEELIPVVDYDTDYFEDRFAVDKTRESDKKRKEEVLKKIKVADRKSQIAKQPVKKKIANQKIQNTKSQAEKIVTKRKTQSLNTSSEKEFSMEEKGSEISSTDKSGSDADVPENLPFI